MNVNILCVFLRTNKQMVGKYEDVFNKYAEKLTEAPIQEFNPFDY